MTSARVFPLVHVDVQCPEAGTCPHPDWCMTHGCARKDPKK